MVVDIDTIPLLPEKSAIAYPINFVVDEVGEVTLGAPCDRRAEIAQITVIISPRISTT